MTLALEKNTINTELIVIKRIESEAFEENQRLKATNNQLIQQSRQLQASFETTVNELEKRLAAEFRVREAAIRKDAIERARVVNKGFDGETFSPLLQDRWTSKDFRHIGDPIDFLILAGADAIRAELQDTIDEVILLEVKTGSADMNKVQRRVRDAVVEGRVQFGIFNPDEDSLRLWSKENPKGKTVI